MWNCMTLVTRVLKQPTTVKLRYNGLGYQGYSVNTDFFSCLGWVLISASDNMVWTDAASMDFHLLQTSLLVPTLRTCWIQQTNWDQDHGWHAYVIMTAVLLVAASWERPSLCRDDRTAMDTSRRSRHWNQLILLLMILVPVMLDR